MMTRGRAIVNATTSSIGWTSATRQLGIDLVDGGADTGGQRLRGDARADDERHHARRQLRVGNVDDRIDVNVK